MLNFQDFFAACSGFWTTQRTYHSTLTSEVERSYTEYRVTPLIMVEKQEILVVNQAGLLNAGIQLDSDKLLDSEAACPGFAISFETRSETGEEVSMSLQALFIPDLYVAAPAAIALPPSPIAAQVTMEPGSEVLQGFYLRDQGYSETGAIAGGNGKTGRGGDDGTGRWQDSEIVGCGGETESGERRTESGETPSDLFFSPPFPSPNFRDGNLRAENGEPPSDLFFSPPFPSPILHPPPPIPHPFPFFLLFRHLLFHDSSLSPLPPLPSPLHEAAAVYHQYARTLPDSGIAGLCETEPSGITGSPVTKFNSGSNSE
jgi:hypothetical protein